MAKVDMVEAKFGKIQKNNFRALQHAVKRFQ